ncbi:MAG: hypothetical protein U0R19_12350 [Bryobacteraceae bacterium]
MKSLTTIGVALMVAATLGAQPPAQGPAPATVNAHSLPITAITGKVMEIVNGIVADQNAALATDPNYRAVISVTPTIYSPAMVSTANLDRPNEFAALTPYFLSYKVTGLKANVAGVWVSYPFDRTLYQSIYVQTTCDGWYKGRGVLKHVTRAEAPTLDTDHTFLEEAFSFLLVNRLPTYIDQQMTLRLANIPAIVAEVPTTNACNTLGVSTKAQGFPFDTINYDAFPVIPQVAPNSLTVTLLQVKRLPLKRLSGQPVYDPVEEPALEFWADFANLHFNLPPMVENQVWFAPAKATVTVPVPPSSRQLVLIGNMVYDGGNSEDASWVSFGKSADFGNGVKVFRIMKNWFEPAPKGGRPIKSTGPGYEVTVRIATPVTSTTQF